MPSTPSSNNTIPICDTVCRGETTDPDSSIRYTRVDRVSYPAGSPTITGMPKSPIPLTNVRVNAAAIAGRMSGIVTSRCVRSAVEPDSLDASSNSAGILRSAAVTTKYAIG